eukprot:CAMPEP_0194277550 /NCGR_PEP_ID=MMETSP0169-20130528/9860_1 /TAXON_ID=218684 /ORGANISM="Corethron pennatum, Strain L29A3" /LENGTH=298 /DNA_ID=CAMNT_0039021559 /DNA_START=70 /DNA_END=963 /DNA_ORIENTATION=+
MLSPLFPPLSLGLLAVASLLRPADGLAPPTASSWQRRLDKALLDLDATPESRFRNLQRAIKDPALRTDVTAALDAVRTRGFGGGHPELINLLWPTGTTARADLEGLAALRTQVPEALRELPGQLKKNREQQRSGSTFAPPTSGGFGGFPQPEEIKEELKNVLRSTPKGLEAPKYTVVRVLDGAVKLGVPEKIEIRQYEAFTVATTPSMGGAGFTTLASYLFGGNEEEEAMAMTMPVFTSGQTDQGEMKFVLPSAVRDAPPTPRSGAAVTLEKIPARLVATKAFPGLVTDEEAARQETA